MSIVKYKCDVCKREIELQRNVHGLETPNRCIITHGCRGKLYFKELLPDFVRGKSPENVIGLEDWQQRKVLYDHFQTIQRDEWTIEHNLGNSVNTSVFVNRPIEGNEDNLEEIDPESIIIDSPDQIRVQFDRPYSGRAQLVARASDPDLLRPKIILPEAAAVIRQLSIEGELTIAIKIPVAGVNPTIQFEVLFATSQETSQLITYTVNDSIDIISPWSDTATVIINGAAYVIRSFNIQVPEMVSGVIGNGSTFIFTTIDDDNTSSFREIEPNEVFILLSTPPHEVADKDTEFVIDITDITLTTNTFKLAYDSGDFFGDSVIEQSVYPPVRLAT